MFIADSGSKWTAVNEYQFKRLAAWNLPEPAFPRLPRTRTGRTEQRFWWRVQESIFFHSALPCFRALTVCVSFSCFWCRLLFFQKQHPVSIFWTRVLEILLFFPYCHILPSLCHCSLPFGNAFLLFQVICLVFTAQLLTVDLFSIGSGRVLNNFLCLLLASLPLYVAVPSLQINKLLLYSSSAIWKIQVTSVPWA